MAARRAARIRSARSHFNASRDMGVRNNVTRARAHFSRSTRQASMRAAAQQQQSWLRRRQRRGINAAAACAAARRGICKAKKRRKRLFIVEKKKASAASCRKSKRRYSGIGGAKQDGGKQSEALNQTVSGI